MQSYADYMHISYHFLQALMILFAFTIFTAAKPE